MNQTPREHASHDGTGADYVLFILLDTPGPEQQRRLATAVQEHIDTWVRHCPGYVATRLHLATDGRTIVNHAQWADEDHYRRNFQEHPRKKDLDASIAAYATGAPRPIPCQVSSRD